MEKSSVIRLWKPAIKDAQARRLDHEVVFHDADDLVEERERLPGWSTLAMVIPLSLLCPMA
jgi:hypothetical protein